jgi:hypothetical protein
MTYSRALLAASGLALAQLSLAADSASSFGNAQAIQADRLRAHLEFIAADELEGRDTPSRGLNTAAKYIAAQLKLWGLKPGGDDGTFFQRIPLQAPVFDAAKSVLQIDGRTLKPAEDYTGSRFPGEASGELVYMGDGYHIPNSADDPYSKIDAKGKILVVISAQPKGLSFQDIRAGKAIRPQESAQKFGAAGLITLSTVDDERWARSGENTGRGRGGGPQPVQAEGDADRVPSLTVRAKALAETLGMSVEQIEKMATDREPGAPKALGKQAQMKIAVNLNLVYTQNVIAIFEGSDSKLKNEYVSVGAHYDHVGMREGEGDTIYNGADDDGSGTVGLLEMAHAFATGKKKPKRSILFIWHAGEEKGMWGSEHFVNNPTVPLESIIANLNMDMIGRSRAVGDERPANARLSGPDAIYLVGTTRMSTELGALAKKVNDRLYKIQYDFTYDDLKHPERIFFRSDHYSYAQKGIPILFWFDGVSEHYHQVSDHVETIDFGKIERVGRTVFAMAWELANAKSRPKVDMPLPQ